LDNDTNLLTVYVHRPFSISSARIIAVSAKRVALLALALSHNASNYTARAGKVRAGPGEALIDGVRFLGATLWTDFGLFGEENLAAAVAAAETQMTDFRLILFKTQHDMRFTPQIARRLHLNSVRAHGADSLAIAARVPLTPSSNSSTLHRDDGVLRTTTATKRTRRSLFATSAAIRCSRFRLAVGAELW
jgi:hypothetical protein